MELVEFINIILQYVIVPVMAFVMLVYRRQQDHHLDIAVLKSWRDSDKRSHEREIEEIRNMTNKIFVKLDSIEGSLRK